MASSKQPPAGKTPPKTVRERLLSLGLLMRLQHLAEELRASYWLLPSVMILGGIVLAALAIELDLRYGEELVGSFGWLRAGDFEASYSLLSTIAASSLSVVSLVFSMTIVALTLTASQLGPGILYTFLKDRGSQLVLGSFLGTFVYCLLVLKASSVDLVPQISVTLALTLALVNVGFLVFFFHHLLGSIQPTRIIQQMASELDGAIDRVMPESGTAHPERRHLAADPTDLLRSWPVSRQINSESEGYLEAMDTEQLVQLGVEHDLVIQLYASPGDFVIQGEKLATVHTRRPLDPGNLEEQIEPPFFETFVFTTRPTPVQNLEYAIRNLVEIALRALSPGINNPFTALLCIDRLGAGLSRIAARPELPTACRDDQNQLRLLLPDARFEATVHECFGQIRHYGSENVVVLTHLLGRLAAVAPFCTEDSQRTALLRQAELILEEQAPNLASRDRDLLQQCFQQCADEIRECTIATQAVSSTIPA